MQLESVVPGPPISNQQSNPFGRAILAAHGTNNVTINVSSQDPPVHLARLGHIFRRQTRTA